MEKGDCYQASIKLMLKPSFRDSATLCHGWIFSKKLGNLIQHSWVEKDGFVYDYSQGKREVIQKEIYYKLGLVCLDYSYSFVEMCKMLLSTNRAEYWSKQKRKAVL